MEEISSKCCKFFQVWKKLFFKFFEIIKFQGFRLEESSLSYREFQPSSLRKFVEESSSSY